MGKWLRLGLPPQQVISQHKRRHIPLVVARSSTVLLVSLGLHGMLMLLPIPQPSEPPPAPEEKQSEPIQISILPVEPSPVPSPEPEPVFEAPLPEPEPLPLPLPEPPPVDLVPTAPPTATAPEPPETPSPEPFDPTGTNPGDIMLYAPFSETLASVDDSLIANDLRQQPYELNYTGDLCFDNKQVLNSTLGIVIQNPAQLQTGEQITSTGYTAINRALDDWFTQLKTSRPNPTSKLESRSGQTLYEWLAEHTASTDEPYSAYYLNVTILLVNNPCADTD